MAKSQEHGEPQDELPLSTIDTADPPTLSATVTGNEPKLWTISHSTYLDMGGLHVEAEDPTRPGRKWNGSIFIDMLDPKGGTFESSHSPLDRLSLSRKEILDKSKGDGLTKSLAVLQIMYFALSVIARKSQDISSSQMEILTLAFASLAVITYLVLWNKPKGIEVPTTINIVRFADDINKAKNVLTELENRDREHGNSINTAFECYSLRKSNVSFYTFVFVLTLFGGLHCLAWISPFRALLSATCGE